MPTLNATMMLCDYAQAADGKLTVVGGGWQFVGPAPTSMALAVLIEVPQESANGKHTVAVRLRDTQGGGVDGPDGSPVRIDGEFDVVREPGMPPGVPLVMPLPINIPPIELKAGTRYVWELVIDGKDEYTWQVAFNTRPEASTN